MSEKPRPEKRDAAADARGERLKSALRANLARRKAQMRARAAGEAGDTGQTGAGNTKEQKD
jgi:hypothetical protein